jgi:hypothetical protein
MANFINSKNQEYSRYGGGDAPLDFWGLGRFGRMRPVRATPIEDPESEDEFPPLVDWFAPVLTEVFDWPYSSDENGFSFDQSNLYGIRTRCWRGAAYDGDVSYGLVAVPKSLPGGYTSVGRCGRTVLLIDDYIGDQRGSPVSVRFPTKILPNNDASHVASREYEARSNWRPMAFDDKGFSSALSGASTIFANGHVGFRAGSIDFYKGDGVNSGSETWNFGYKIIDQPYGTPPNYIGDSPWVSVGSVTVSYTSSDYNAVESKTMPAILPPAGKVADLGCWNTHPDDPYPNDRHTSLKSFKAAPRTDVPLWYFASTKNKCAPGGIIVS